MSRFDSLPLPRPDDRPEVGLFLRVLEEVFHHQPWSDVEPCARRAWRHIAMINGVDWDQVRDSLESGWRLH